MVADVGKYKFFLPYCKDSLVLRTTPPHFMLVCTTYLRTSTSFDPTHHIHITTSTHPPTRTHQAQLLVGFNPALGERYTSRVRLERPRAITTAALDSQIFSRCVFCFFFVLFICFVSKDVCSGPGVQSSRRPDTHS